MKRKVVRKGTSSKLDSYKKTFRSNTILLGQVERHVVTQKLDNERESHVIHPSEICKSDTCHRQIYYRIVGAEAKTDGIDTSFHLERVFEEGHDIHHKWQTWLWQMGKLYGYWECLNCEAWWYARSPEQCLSCGAPPKWIRYREVPVKADDYLISGHADGEVDEGLIEVKSIGVGTLRFEAPGFHDKFQSGEWTLQDTWNAIKRPFPTHVRQGMIYCFCKQKDQVIFIYEWKPTQMVKEFVVKYNEEIIEPVLEACLDIKYAVEKEKPLPRPKWASPTAKACKACVYKEVCYAEASGPEKRRRVVRKG